MDYKQTFKEELNKLLFLEIDVEKFKRSINIPDNVKLKTKDLYIPISSKYLADNAGDTLKVKNLPIYYFIEGMLIALGADKELAYLEDYIILLNNIKDSEECGRSLVADRIKNDNNVEAYLLIKGLYTATGDEEYFKRMLLIGEAIREKDKGFTETLLEDIDDGKKEFEEMSDPYLYKAIILREKGDYQVARAELNEYKRLGGKITKEIEGIEQDIENVSSYEKAIEEMNKSPEKSIKTFLGLLEHFDKNPLIYYYLAVAYRKLENYEKAIYYLNESLQIETGILEVINEMGINYACLGAYDEAIKYFRKGFEASKDVEICTNIIMCYMNLGDKENALKHLAIAKKLKPEDDVVQKLSRMLEDK